MGEDGGAGRGIRVDAAAAAGGGSEGRGWRRRAMTAWGVWLKCTYFCGEGSVEALLHQKKVY